MTEPRRHSRASEARTLAVLIAGLALGIVLIAGAAESRDGLRALVAVSQLKAADAGSDTGGVADKQRDLVKEKKKARRTQTPNASRRVEVAPRPARVLRAK